MAKKPDSPDNADQMSFEQCLGELEIIVEAMERGEVPLADSLRQYERGVALIKRCRGLLAAAEKKIELLTEDEKGTLSAKPLKVEEAEEPDAEDDRPAT